MKKFNDKVQELLNSILKKSPSNENDINIDEISDDAYIDDVFAETAAMGHVKVTFDDPNSLRFHL